MIWEEAKGIVAVVVEPAALLPTVLAATEDEDVEVEVEVMRPGP